MYNQKANQRKRVDAYSTWSLPIENILINSSFLAKLTRATVTGYFAQIPNHQRKFERYEEALALVRKQRVVMAEAEAISAGAREPLVACLEKEIIPGMMAHLSARATGKPDISGQE